MESVTGIDLPSRRRNSHGVRGTGRRRPADRNVEDGMGVAVGGFRETTDGVQYNCLAHNTIRGAAGASVLNGELLAKSGYCRSPRRCGFSELTEIRSP